MNKSAFRDWTLTKLDKRFDLTQLSSHPVLDSWLAFCSENQLSEYERTSLNILKQKAIKDVDNWNEQEYSLYFVVDGESISGKPDGIIACGLREPEAPYFCLQEYKRERDPHGDPAGQCLAAMLVAQELNQHEHPIYGGYVSGRNWFFMSLQGNEYAISNSYTVTQDQIYDVFWILVELKDIITKLLDTSKG